MRRFVKWMSFGIGALGVSPFALADAGAAAASDAGLIAIGSALAIGLAALGGTLAQGKVAGAALEGVTRNPGSKDAIFIPLVLTLALIEFQAIMGFIIAFLWIGKVV